MFVHGQTISQQKWGYRACFPSLVRPVSHMNLDTTGTDSSDPRVGTPILGHGVELPQ